MSNSRKKLKDIFFNIFSFSYVCPQLISCCWGKRVHTTCGKEKKIRLKKLQKAKLYTYLKFEKLKIFFDGLNAFSYRKVLPHYISKHSSPKTPKWIDFVIGLCVFDLYDQLHELFIRVLEREQNQHRPIFVPSARNPEKEEDFIFLEREQKLEKGEREEKQIHLHPSHLRSW